MQLRKIINTRGHFPSDEAATKLLWLALRNITDGKVRSTRETRPSTCPEALAEVNLLSFSKIPFQR